MCNHEAVPKKSDWTRATEMRAGFGERGERIQVRGRGCKRARATGQPGKHTGCFDPLPSLMRKRAVLAVLTLRNDLEITLPNHGGHWVHGESQSIVVVLPRVPRAPRG